MLLSTMMGNGATAEIDAALHAKLDAAQLPVYVVLTRTPPDVTGGYSVDEEITALVHAALDQDGDGDGVYYVHTSQGDGFLAVYGDIDPSVTNDDTLFSLARYTALQDQVQPAIEATDPELDVPAVVEAAVVLDIAADATIPDYERPVLTDDQVAVYTARPWVSAGYVFEDDQDAPPGIGFSTLVGVTVALVVAVAGYRLLRATTWALGRREAAAEAQRAQVLAARASAMSSVATLERSLEQPTPRQSRGADCDLASRCADMARDLVDADGLLDLVGAGVLAQTGAAALQPSAARRRTFALPPSAMDRIREAHDRRLQNEADAELLALGEAVDATDIGARHDREAWQAALDHYDAAKRALALADSPAHDDDPDVLDLVGALVLARRGRAAFSAAVAGRRWSPPASCYLNPLHGAVVGHARLRSTSADDVPQEVPVCAGCRTALKAGSTPDVLDVVHRGQACHYFDTDVEPWASTGFGSLDRDLVAALHRTRR